MGRILLDPNAASYTDDEIVGKVNSATVNITRADSIEGTAVSALSSDDIGEGSSNKYDTGAPIPVLSDDEVITAINSASSSITREDALSQTDLKLVKSLPQSGERAVESLSVDSGDKLATDFNDTPEP